jgi:hypothetical protein
MKVAQHLLERWHFSLAVCIIEKLQIKKFLLLEGAGVLTSVL